MPRIRLPIEAYRLEEINLPEDLAQQLAGQMVEVEVVPQELPGTRRVEITDSPALIARDGTVWNDYRPTRLSFQDTEGRKWNLPRHWQGGHQKVAEPVVEASSQVFRECKFLETVHLPSAWDLQDINIPPGEAERAGGHTTQVLVILKPNDVIRVYWSDSSGTIWRIPQDWRRRRIRLPGPEVLADQGVPQHVAEAYGGAEVSVNYHPGSLCCLRDGYRFRDDTGQRWPVQMRDCTILGFGTGRTGRA